MSEKRADRENRKPIEWMGSSLKDVRSFPKDARITVGEALASAQVGERHPKAKQMKGKLREVIEIVASSDGQTFRATYAAKFGDVVYMLHAFNKKSTKGKETPKRDTTTIESRLRAAKEHYEKGLKGK